METLTWLQPRPGGVYVDATLGGGGHAEAILDSIVPGGRLIGIDRDEQALEQASRRLERFGGAVTLIRENFAALKVVLQSLGLDRAEGVRRAIPRRAWPRTIDAATRTFQALRIAVNDELSNLENAIPAAAEVLREAGRLCAITFHSLEDRTVKHTLLRLSRGCTRSPGSSACTNGETRWLRVLTKKPITPTPAEIARNPRARSAKLRVAERMPDDSTE